MNIPIEFLKGRRQLAWSGQSQCPNIEGSRNVDFGELESYRALLRNRISLLPQVVLLVPRQQLEMIIAVSVMHIEYMKRVCIVLCCSGSVEAHNLSW